MSALFNLVSNLDQAQVERAVKALESIAASLDVLVQSTLVAPKPKPAKPAGVDALHDVSYDRLTEIDGEIAAMRKQGLSETDILARILREDYVPDREAEASEEDEPVYDEL